MDQPQPDIPTESAPQPVPGHPGWFWWPGVGGVVYAKHPNKIDPPTVVRAHNFTALLAAIRKREAERHGPAD